MHNTVCIDATEVEGTCELAYLLIPDAVGSRSCGKKADIFIGIPGISLCHALTSHEIFSENCGGICPNPKMGLRQYATAKMVSAMNTENPPRLV